MAAAAVSRGRQEGVKVLPPFFICLFLFGLGGSVIEYLEPRILLQLIWKSQDGLCFCFEDEDREGL